MVKCLPTMWETQVQSLGREDVLEKEMAPHSSILAWKIPWMKVCGRLQSTESQRVGHDWATSLFYVYCKIESMNKQVNIAGIQGSRFERKEIQWRKGTRKGKNSVVPALEWADGKEGGREGRRKEICHLCPLKGPRLCNQRRQWQPTPVLLPGKSHGRRSLVCCSPWGR